MYIVKKTRGKIRMSDDMATESRLIAGDCLEVMRGWDESVIDLTVTSPPYDNMRDYKGFAFEFEAIARDEEGRRGRVGRGRPHRRRALHDQLQAGDGVSRHRLQRA